MLFKIGKSKDKPEEGAADNGDTLVMTTAGPDAKAPQPASDAAAPDENKDTSSQPHEPLAELSVETENEKLDEADSASALASEPEETDEEEVKLVEVEATDLTQAAEATKEQAKANAPEATPAKAESTEAADDSLSKLFGNDEEEANPLAALIDALPDVTTKELLDDLQEIKGLINERE